MQLTETIYIMGHKTKLIAPAVILILVAVMLSCRTSKHAAAEPPGILHENFDRFYDRFHSDTVFQLSRVRFPLGGYRADGMEEVKWSRDNWPYMRTRIYDVDTTIYKISYKKTENEFVQKVWLENSGFSSESRFRLIKNKWFLVYVLDLNL